MIEWLLNIAKKNPGPHMRGFMKRYFLFRSKPFSILFHEIFKEDPGSRIYGLYHTHSFHYISIVLRGSYKEIIQHEDLTVTEKIRKPGSIIFHTKKFRHRLIPLTPKILTFIFRFGDSAGEWGTYDDAGNYTSRLDDYSSLPKKKG